MDDPGAFLIVDECHLVTNEDNELHLSVGAWCQGLILMSGTPVRNSASELRDLAGLCNYKFFEYDDEQIML